MPPGGVASGVLTEPSDAELLRPGDRRRPARGGEPCPPVLPRPPQRRRKLPGRTLTPPLHRRSGMRPQ
eukprot:12804883-Prorocentrum_lima.AAC.1